MPNNCMKYYAKYMPNILFVSCIKVTRDNIHVRREYNKKLLIKLYKAAEYSIAFWSQTIR